MMDAAVAKIAVELEALVNTPALLIEDALGDRTRALESLSFAHETLQRCRKLRPDDALPAYLQEQVQQLTGELRRVNQELFSKVRERMRSGELSSSALRALFDRYTPYEPRIEAHLHLSFDALDVLVAGILHEEPPPRPVYALDSEMVAFQPSPVSAILELIDRAAIAPSDTFYDLGSGLGDLPIVVTLLTGADAIGVEIDPVLCAYGRASARRLGLAGVTFLNAEAKEVDYSAGTVFYLFTPFVGGYLTAVMERLRQVSRTHPIRIGTYGPITPIVTNLPWLRSINHHGDDAFRLAVLESR